MIKRIEFITLVVIICSSILLVGCGHNTQQESIDETQNIKRVVELDEILSSVDIEEVTKNFGELIKAPRKRGTENNYIAGEYLCKKMKEYGYNVETQEFNGYTSKLTSMAKDFNNVNYNNEQTPLFVGRNIIAKRDDYDATKKTLIISAHYDTTTDNIGALDNGSGVCALLEVARITFEKDLPYNLEFIFFDSEEYYLLGSRNYVNSLDDTEKNNIIANINIDLVGNKKARGHIFISDHENVLFESAQKIFQGEEIKFSTWGQSDDVSFLKNGIDAIWYTSVDAYNSEFDMDLLVKEDNSDSVGMDFLVEDIKFITRYIVGVNELQ